MNLTVTGPNIFSGRDTIQPTKLFQAISPITCLVQSHPFWSLPLTSHHPDKLSLRVSETWSWPSPSVPLDCQENISSFCDFIQWTNHCVRLCACVVIAVANGFLFYCVYLTFDSVFYVFLCLFGFLLVNCIICLLF